MSDEIEEVGKFFERGSRANNANALMTNPGRRQFCLYHDVFKHDVTKFMCFFFFRKKDKYYNETPYMFFPFIKQK